MLSRWIAKYVPSFCCFCLSPAEDKHFCCQFCKNLLPYNQPACLQCASPLSKLHSLCLHCLIHPQHCTYRFAAFRYAEDIERLLIRFKYHYDLKCGAILYELFWQTLLLEKFLFSQVNHFEGIIAMPSDHQRTLKRGFDHTLWLAQRLGRDLHKPIYKVKRLTTQPRQQSLTQYERWFIQSHQAFKFPRKIPTSVLIFDDVMTTGASMEALASAFLQQGGQRVFGLAIARTIKQRL